MARKMKKFSAGGAQGRYDRRMADIDKDFKKDSAGKSGKALEVLEAKRAQRTADAKDDLAKRTGADRTATRAAESAAERNLTMTRKYGAPKAVTTEAPTAKITDTLGAITAPKSGIKPKTTREAFNEAFRAARNDPAAMKRGNFTFNGEKFSTKMASEGRKAPAPAAKTPAPAAPAKTTPPATPAKTTPKPVATTPKPVATSTPNLTAALLTAKAIREKAEKDKAAKEKEARATKVAENAKRFTSRNVQSAYGAANMAKGGKVKKEKTMKYRSGGSTASQPVPPKKKPKEPITGGANTVPLTPERKEFLKELAKRNAKPGMAKGGKAATKFGAAMKKKSADTKGRAMMKFAKGGSIDGVAKKGKTKGKMV
jgi:hypothetical protein